MARVKFAIFIVVQSLLAALFVQRSPYMMDSTKPTRPWADRPMRLITTPQFETRKTDLFTTGATHMCLLHNAIIRGFNSIYLQAPHVPAEDTAAFIGYSLTWYRFVKSHHDDEEANLFNKVEEVLGDDQIWEETHEEHDLFLPGLEKFHAYLSGLVSPSAFSPAELIRIMDSFRHPFEHHFHHEIAIIASMATHPRAPAPDSPEAAAASAIFKAWGKKTVTKAGTTDVVPFFLLNLDATAEGGMWASWPPMPAPVRWMLVSVFGAWYGPWWRFASCDAQGQPRELFAMQFVPVPDGEL